MSFRFRTGGPIRSSASIPKEYENSSPSDLNDGVEVTVRRGSYLWEDPCPSPEISGPWRKGLVRTRSDHRGRLGGRLGLGGASLHPASPSGRAIGGRRLPIDAYTLGILIRRRTVSSGRFGPIDDGRSRDNLLRTLVLPDGVEAREKSEGRRDCPSYGLTMRQARRTESASSKDSGGSVSPGSVPTTSSSRRFISGCRSHTGKQSWPACSIPTDR